MNIGGVSSANAVLKRLEANGLSVSKAKLVDSDLTAAIKAGSAGAGKPADATSVRAALDTRIAADVLSGKLSASDAATVRKTLDESDGQASTGDAASPSQTRAASKAGGNQDTDGGGAKGGGGGAPAKTELSEIVTVTGSTKTTVITYTDSTTSTTTATATAGDKAKYGAKSGATSHIADEYLATLKPGSLIDETA